MERAKSEGITPYRMSQIMNTAARVTEMIVSGKTLYHPTYDECEIVIELVAEAIRKSKNEYRRE